MSESKVNSVVHQCCSCRSEVERLRKERDHHERMHGYYKRKRAARRRMGIETDPEPERDG